MQNIVAFTEYVVFVFDTPDQASVEEFMIAVGYSTRNYYLGFEGDSEIGDRTVTRVDVKSTSSGRWFIVQLHGGDMN